MAVTFRTGIALIGALLLAACAGTPKSTPASHRPAPHRPEKKPSPPSAPPKPPPPRNAIEQGVSAGPPVSSLDLTPESAAAAKDAFVTSCRVLVRRKDASGLTQGTDWQPACTAAAVPGADPLLFFQQQFETAIIGDGNTYDTGYYEPEIEGSRTRAPGYDTPVYRRPPDLVEADPGVVAGGQPTGKKQRGRVQDGKLVLYYERAEIDNGVLANQGLEIAWAADPIELFFLEIQGSGRLHLPDGSIMRIGYDGQNGREYVGIGKWMRDQGLIGGTTGYATSMQGIMQWLREHPDQAAGVMQQNKSYIFFREIVGPGPLGALGVPVVGHVSVAADPNFTPLGAPIFIAADRPEVTGMWVAQDTGGAIRGANRFDTFWGAGMLARMTAGGMAARGKALILLPRGTVARLAAANPSAIKAVTVTLPPRAPAPTAAPAIAPKLVAPATPESVAPSASAPPVAPPAAQPAAPQPPAAQPVVPAPAPAAPADAVPTVTVPQAQPVPQQAAPSAVPRTPPLLPYAPVVPMPAPAKPDAAPATPPQP